MRFRQQIQGDDTDKSIELKSVSSMLICVHRFWICQTRIEVYKLNKIGCFSIMSSIDNQNVFALQWASKNCKYLSATTFWIACKPWCCRTAHVWRTSWIFRTSMATCVAVSGHTIYIKGTIKLLHSHPWCIRRVSSATPATRIAVNDL